MSVTLRIDGLYVDDNFTHVETQYTIGRDSELSDVIDSYTSENADEKYEYEFSYNVHRGEPLYYLIVVVVEDEDENRYEISSGITNHNTYGQVVENKTLIFTPKLEILRDTFLTGEQVKVSLSEFKSLDSTTELESVTWAVKDINGNTLYRKSNDTENLDKKILPNNIIKHHNIIIFEAVFNNSLKNSFVGRKVFVREVKDRFISLVSEPVLYRKIENSLSFRTNSLNRGRIVVSVRNKKNNMLIFDYIGESVEYMFDQFIIKIKSLLIEPNNTYIVSVSSTLLNGKDVTNTFELDGKSNTEYYLMYEIFYRVFNLKITKINNYDLPRYATFTKEYQTGLVPMIMPDGLVFYDLNDNVINNNLVYNFGSSYDVVEANVEILDNSFLVHLVHKDDDDKLSMRVVKVDFDFNNGYSIDFNRNVIGFGDNYINSGISLFWDTLEFIYSQDRNSFKRCSLPTDGNTITEESDEISDLDIYLDRIDNSDNILIAGVRLRDVNKLVCYAEGVISVIDRYNDNVTILEIEDASEGNVKLFRTDDNKVIITSSDDLTHSIDIIEYDYVTNTYTKYIKTDITAKTASIVTTLDNKLEILSPTVDGHRVYTLN